MTNITRSTLRAPKELIDALKEIAKQRGLTMNSVIIDALWDWLDKINQKPNQTNRGKEQ